jgi:cell division protein ZapA (FtsZ GTPase activity inhibitor)
MKNTELFSDRDLEKIIDEGMVYMCACPAQVADALRKVREMYRYQISCLSDSNNDSRVHRTIGRTAIAVQHQLEECLEKVLEIEQWDRATLTMPAGLRARQHRELGEDTEPI